MSASFPSASQITYKLYVDYPCDEDCPACSRHFSNANQLINHRCADEPSPDLRRRISDRHDTVVKEISTKLNPQDEEFIVRSYARKRRKSGRRRSHSIDHPAAGSPKGHGTSAEVVPLSMLKPGAVQFVDDGSEALAVDNQDEAQEQSQSRTPTDRVFQSNEGDACLRTDQSFPSLGALNQSAQNSGTTSGTIGDLQHYGWESGQAVNDQNQMISNGGNPFLPDELTIFSQLYCPDRHAPSTNNMWTDAFPVSGSTGWPP